MAANFIGRPKEWPLKTNSTVLLLFIYAILDSRGFMFCLRQYLMFTIITTCGRYVWFRSGDESSKVVFTSGQVYVHRIPVTTSSVTTSNRLLWANNFQWNQHLFIDHNVKKFSYNEHPGSTSTFLCIKLFVVSGTQCTCLETANTKVFLHITSVSSEYVLE